MDVVCADEFQERAEQADHDLLTRTDFTTEYKSGGNSATAPLGGNVRFVFGRFEGVLKSFPSLSVKQERVKRQAPANILL